MKNTVFRKIVFLKLFCFTALLLDGCRTLKDGSISEVAHTANETGLAPNLSYWAQLSEQELDTLVFGKNSSAASFPIQKTDSSLRQYLQALSDAVYDVIKNSLQARNAVIFFAPRPKLYVVMDKRLNAFNAPQKFRFPLHVESLSAGQKSPYSESNLLLQSEATPKAIIADVDSENKCSLLIYQRSIETIPLGKSAQLANVLARENSYLKEHGANCAFASWNNSTGIVNPGCDLALASDWFVATQMLPALFINSGVFLNNSLNFESLTWLIAHEMGHYLMAHGIRGAQYNRINNPIDTARYDYLYNELDYIQGGEPKPLSPELDKLAEAAMVEATKILPTPMNGKFDSIYALYALAVGSVDSMATPREAGQLAEEAAVIANSINDFSATMTLFLEHKCRLIVQDASICAKFHEVSRKINSITIETTPEQLNHDGVALLHEYSSLLEKFARGIKVENGNCKNHLDDTTLCSKSLLNTGVFEMQYYRILNRNVEIAVDNMKDLFLSDWLQIVKHEYDKLLKINRESILFLSDNTIGWYTDEQQADDIALESLASLGIDPHCGISFAAKIAAELVEEALSPEEYVSIAGYPLAKTCTELEKLGFRDEHQQWLRVKNLDWVNTHHNLCYRAFNMTREVELHNYTVKQISPKLREMIGQFSRIKAEGSR